MSAFTWRINSSFASVRVTNRFLLRYLEHGLFALFESNIPPSIYAIMWRVLQMTYPHSNTVQDYVGKLIGDNLHYLAATLVNISESLFYPSMEKLLQVFQSSDEACYVKCMLILNIQKYAPYDYIAQLNKTLLERPYYFTVPMLVLQIFAQNYSIQQNWNTPLIVITIKSKQFHQNIHVGGSLAKLLRMMAFIFTSIDYYSPLYHALDHELSLHAFKSDFNISEVVFENEWNRLLECAGSTQRVSLIFE